MSEPGLRLSMNQFTCRDLALPVLARAAADEGFEGVGLLPSTLAELGVDKVRRVLAETGLEATSVCAFIGLVGATATERAERLRKAQTCLRYAAELSAPLVVVVGGPTSSLTLTEARHQLDDVLAQLMDAAHSLGSRVLLEPLHPTLVEQSVLVTLEEGARLAAAHPGLGLVLDTWHVWWDPRLADVLADQGSAVDIVHLADWAAAGAGSLDRELPGAGVSDLVSVSRQLLSTGFSGWWEVEVLSEKYWATDQLQLLGDAFRATTSILRQARLSLASTRD